MHDAVITALLRWHATPATPSSTTHTVTAAEAGERITLLAGSAFDDLGSKSQSRAAIKKGRLLLNGGVVESSRRVKLGDVLDYTPASSSFDTTDAERLQSLARFCTHLQGQGMRTPYEDDDVAIVYKPAGVHTKSGTNRRYAAFEDAIPAELSLPPASKPRLPQPLVMHRLDVPVSGLCVVAKTRPAAMHIAKQFEERRVSKWYHALLVGVPDERIMEIDDPIDGLPSRTELEVLSVTPHAQWGHLTSVRMKPVTGRTHQLRIHAAEALRCPIVGDDLYWERAGAGAPALRKSGGLFLQSCGVRLELLDGSELTVSVPEARKFRALRSRAESGAAYNSQ